VSNKRVHRRQNGSTYLAKTYSISLHKIEIVKNVCEPINSKDLPPVKLPKNIFKICYVGNLNSGHLLLEKLIASAVYLRNLLNFRFYIIGEGRLRPNLEALAKKLNVDDFVEFTGFLNRKKAYFYISACDVCLVPYRRNFSIDVTNPHKLFEYSAFGKAVVSTPIPSYIRMFGNALYYWKPATARRLAEIIYELFKNDALRQNLGRSCKILVEKNYNWKIEEKKLFKAYQKALR